MSKGRTQAQGLILGALLASGLLACGIAAKVRARNELEESKAEYKECLKLHSEDVSQCEGLRRAYDADLQTYRALSAGVRPGATIEVENPTSPPP